MSGKRVVKLDVKYLKDVIDAMRMINNGTEGFAQMLGNCSKQEAMERWISGLEKSVEAAKSK